MKKIGLLLEYDGSAYHGWQVQKDAQTVQGVLEECIFRVTGQHSPLIGASRTDARVHALGQVAAFRTASRLDTATIKRALNALLPRDIRVLSASEAQDAFHPRNDALMKRYFYMISNQRATSAFLSRYAWEVPQALNISLMESASQTLVGRHDFASFMGAGSDVADTVREIYALTIEKMDWVTFMTSSLQGNFLKITVEANGFLRHMVRNIVGTLIEIGRGRIPSSAMTAILESRKRNNAGRTAPAHGLFLEKIEY